jgi:transposase-like protein
VIVEYHYVEISRFICSQCDATHALLVWFLPPYSRHTFRFILAVLETYFFHDMTIEELCSKYDITHPTLYAWVNKYQDQYYDLRKLFSPPMLPDAPPELQHCVTNGETHEQAISAQTDKETNDRSITDLTPTNKRRCMLSAFGEKVFTAIKALVWQDASSVFKDFYDVHGMAFFEIRHIYSGANKPRASPHGR